MKTNDKKNNDNKNNNNGHVTTQAEAIRKTPSEVAFHEAGHAVAAVVFHVSFKHAVVTEGGHSLGHVQHDVKAVLRVSERVRNGDARRSEIERRIQVALAGVVAAELAGAPGQGGESDEDGAQTLAELTCTDVAADEGVEVRAYLAWLTAVVRNRLRQEWAAVEKVAAALDRGEMVKAREIRGIVARARTAPPKSGFTVPESALDEEMTPELTERLIREMEHESPNRLTGQTVDRGSEVKAAE